MHKKENNKTECDFNLREGKIKQVEDVVYLGGIISTHRRLNSEILRYMNKSKMVIGSVGAIILPRSKI